MDGVVWRVQDSFTAMSAAMWGSGLKSGFSWADQLEPLTGPLPQIGLRGVGHPMWWSMAPRENIPRGLS